MLFSKIFYFSTILATKLLKCDKYTLSVYDEEMTYYFFKIKSPKLLICHKNEIQYLGNMLDIVVVKETNKLINCFFAFWRVPKKDIFVAESATKKLKELNVNKKISKIVYFGNKSNIIY
jgi:hypothetical protein